MKCVNTELKPSHSQTDTPVHQGNLAVLVYVGVCVKVGVYVGGCLCEGGVGVWVCGVGVYARVCV